MAGPVWDSNNSDRLRAELGFERWEAICHFLSDGDYLGFNRLDFRGAIAEFEKAWDLLDTDWQRQAGGTDILKGIADFAIRSEDPELARDTLDDLLPRAAQLTEISLHAECERLRHLADQKRSPA